MKDLSLNLAIGSSGGLDGLPSVQRFTVAVLKALHDSVNPQQFRAQNHRGVGIVVHAKTRLRSRATIKNRQCTHCGVVIRRYTTISTKKRVRHKLNCIAAF